MLFKIAQSCQQGKTKSLDSAKRTSCSMHRGGASASVKRLKCKATGHVWLNWWRQIINTDAEVNGLHERKKKKKKLNEKPRTEWNTTWNTTSRGALESRKKERKKRKKKIDTRAMCWFRNHSYAEAIIGTRHTCRTTHASFVQTAVAQCCKHKFPALNHHLNATKLMWC